MSTLNNSPTIWPSISKDTLDSKYEKCRNITEEIYKRINITFQIKQLETAAQSDVSEQSDPIDSNELSNETDLFACDKSDSLPSSTETERPSPLKAACDKYININNNEEKKAAAAVYKRPRKRFRKRVKKRQQTKAPSSDGSSDEALPLSRMVEVDTKAETPGGSPERVMGVPKIIIVTKDLKPRILSSDKKPKKPDKKVSSPKANTNTATDDKDNESINTETMDKKELSMVKEKSLEGRSCTTCNMTFRGERGLRRHMAVSHITSPEPRKSSRTDQRGVKPA